MNSKINKTHKHNFIYRPDIDGLRAIAVISVLLFHVDHELLSGGFVGVDIFFVISGYLITSILLRDIEAGQFSFRTFYDRRIRRIFPALFFVLLVSSAAAFIVLFPIDLYNFSQSLVAVLLFLSNILFWKENDYFDAASDTKPLLHTWSLSIEEQFYFLFPLFILVVYRFFLGDFRTKLFLFLSIILSISFLLSIFMVNNRPAAAFYLLPTRGWELMLGGLVSLLPVVNSEINFRSWLAAMGLVFIIISTVYFNKDISFPGVNALLPCVGAALIIYANHLRDNMNYMGRFLSFKPFVIVGMISYSLYLWHWPVIVFSKHYWMQPPGLLFVLVLSLVIAFISWKYIEQPCRKLLSNQCLYSSLLLIILLLLAFGMLGYFSKGYPERFPKKFSFMYVDDNGLKDPYKESCSAWTNGGISLDKIKHGYSCLLGNKNKKNISFVLMGDSHAVSLYSGIDHSANVNGKKGYFFGHSSCNPVQGVMEKRENENFKCELYKEVFYKKIYADSNIKKVILSARWAAYLYGSTHDLGPAEPATPIKYLLRVSRQPERQLLLPEREFYFSQKMKETILSLINSNKKVTIISSVPEVGYNVPNYMARKFMNGIETELIDNREYFFERHAFLLDFFKELEKIDGVNIIYPHKILCEDKKTCLYEINGQPLYYDDHHLSVKGSEFISPIFDEIFAY
jgi:peptidoglycan/LPS O-acetylase OafA/YrhL